MIFNMLGWLGTFTFIANHLYISNYMNFNRKAYFAVNVFASICIIISSMYIESYLAVFSNIIMGTISFASIVYKKEIRSPLRPIILKIGTSSIIVLSMIYAFFDYNSTFMYLGVASSCMSCCAYLLFSSAKISKRAYFTYGFILPALCIPQLYLDNNNANMLMQMVWSSISLYGLCKILLHTRRSRRVY